MSCCTAWHSIWKLQYKGFRMFGCQSEDKFIFILMKSKHLVHIKMFWEVMRWWHYASIHHSMWPQIQHGGAGLDREGGWWKTLWLTTRLHYFTRAGEPSVGCEIIFAISSPLRASLPKLHFLCVTQFSERPTKLCATPQINWRQW